MTTGPGGETPFDNLDNLDGRNDGKIEKETLINKLGEYMPAGSVERKLKDRNVKKELERVRDELCREDRLC